MIASENRIVPMVVRLFIMAVLAAVCLERPGHAADPAATLMPPHVLALAGCWRGTGDVMGKKVAITLTAKPIVQNAMFLVEAESRGQTNPDDRYAAHLIFGGVKAGTGSGAVKIVGYWADSFGGAYTSTGSGASDREGFQITYRDADAAYVNRWRVAQDRLTWTITARDGKGGQTPFARYVLARSPCVAPKM